MRSWRMVAFSAIAWLVMSAAPALAACADGCGGGMDALTYGEYLWPGQTVTWSADTYTDKAAAGPDAGPFFAYLVEPNRRAVRVPDVDDGMPLGQVAAGTTRDPSLLDVSVTFTVPLNVPLGSYSVEVCDDPCTTRLAYIGTTQVEIVSNEMEARLNQRIDRLSQRVSNLRWYMKDHARRAAKRSTNDLRVEMAITEEKLDMRVSELELMVTELEERLTSQEKSAEREDVSQSALAGGVVVAFLCAWLVRERRRNSLSD